MSDVGILTFVPRDTDRDQRFRNDVAEVEGRLRFILTGRKLNPVFGGEPFHPGDRVIAALPVSRLHLHHVLEAGACVLVVLLVGEVDAGLAASVIRYVDARVSPPLTVFLLGADEMGLRPEPAVLRLSGELKALGRHHETYIGAMRENDARFLDFVASVEKTRDATRHVRLDVRFKDDLRRHHHLSICPGGTAPPSRRLSPLHALAAHGITTSTVGPEELHTRVRWLLGSKERLLDPRLVDLRARRPRSSPGDLAEHAVALAIRDLADERLAFTVTLGPRLPGEASPERVAATLLALKDPTGALAIPICTSTDDDDAGALSQYLLQRASLGVPSQRFRDPQQTRPSDVAITLTIAALENGHAIISIPEALHGSDVLATLSDGPLTATRVAFGTSEPFAAILESTEPLRVSGAQGRLALPLSAESMLRHWPSDRLALMRGRHSERLSPLLAAAGFKNVRPG